MHDEHREAVIELRALQSSATQVWDLVLKRSNEASTLAVSLSSATDLIKGSIDAAVANGSKSASRPPCGFWRIDDQESYHQNLLSGQTCSTLFLISG
jgi:hypothetical protein